MPMLVVIARLGRSTTYALAAGLSAVASNLPALALCACMRSCNSLGDAVRGFWSVLSQLGDWSWRGEALDCRESASTSLQPSGSR